MAEVSVGHLFFILTFLAPSFENEEIKLLIANNLFSRVEVEPTTVALQSLSYAPAQLKLYSYIVKTLRNTFFTYLFTSINIRTIKLCLFMFKHYFYTVQEAFAFIINKLSIQRCDVNLTILEYANNIFYIIYCRFYFIKLLYTY